LLYYFEYMLARILGFGMSMSSCAACGKIYKGSPAATQKIVFDLERGGIVCSGCRDDCRNPFILSSSAIDFLVQFPDTGVSSVEALNCSGKLKLETEKFLWTYLRFHLPELEGVKSAGVFSKLLDNR